MVLQSVAHGNANNLVHIVVRCSPSDFRILKNVNMASASDSSWSEFKPSMTAQTSVSGFIYADQSLYLSIKTNSNFFAVLGSDWVLKFAVSTTTDESLECLQSDLMSMDSDASRVILSNYMQNFQAYAQSEPIENQLT